MSSTELLKVEYSGSTLLSRQYRFVCTAAIFIYVALQFAIGWGGHICGSGDAKLSARANYFYSGGSSSFVVSAISQMIKIIECRSQSGDLNSEGIHVAVLTVNIIAATSFILTFTLNWGGICTDVLGVESTGAQWAEWLVTVPLMVYMTVAMEDKPNLGREDKIIVFVFFLAISFGFLLNFRSMPVSLGYLFFVMGCCSISVSAVLDYFSTMKYRVAFRDENNNRNEIGTLALASKRRTLTRLLLIILPCFPLTHILAQTKVIDREGTFIGYALCSLIAKLLFAGSVSDAHVNLIEGTNKLILAAEIAANKMRRKFLQNIFADVRESTNEITACLSSFNDDQQHPLNQTSKEALIMMKSAACFIHDVISMQKVEYEKFELALEPFLMEEVVQTAIAEIKSSSDAKRISVIVESALDGHVGTEPAAHNRSRLIEVFYLGDRLRLVYVISTFLSNAIKFSPACSQITIKLACIYRDSTNTAQKLAQKAAVKHQRSHVISFFHNAFFGYFNSDTEIEFRGHQTRKVGQAPSDVCEVSLLIIDNGVGINENTVANLFTPYSHRYTDQLQAKRTGLKLMIAKEIVALHGGEVIVESKEGHGSTFGFCIPFDIEFKVTDRSDFYERHLGDGSVDWRQPTSCNETDATPQKNSFRSETNMLQSTVQSRRFGLNSLIIDGKKISYIRMFGIFASESYKYFLVLILYFISLQLTLQTTRSDLGL